MAVWARAKEKAQLRAEGVKWRETKREDPEYDGRIYDDRAQAHMKKWLGYSDRAIQEPQPLGVRPQQVVSERREDGSVVTRAR